MKFFGKTFFSLPFIKILNLFLKHLKFMTISLPLKALRNFFNQCFTLVVVLTSCLFLNTAVAQDDDDDDDFEYVVTPEEVNQLARDDVSVRLEPLGFGLMGDSIDPYTGTLVFNQMDVSIPGNSDLEVAIRRITSTAQMTNNQDLFFGDWILDVPNISTLTGSENRLLYSGASPISEEEIPHPTEDNWATKYYGWTSLRCTETHPSNRDIEVTLGPGTAENIPPSAWWEGIKLNIPGKGSQQLLRADISPMFTEFETSEKDVKLITKDHWLITCLDSVIASSDSAYEHWQGNNGGEGFVAISPKGTRYTMNRLIYTDADEYDNMPRQLAKVYATEVKDVHGNWVKYDFSNDGKLMKIYSSDDREITLSYYTNSHRIHTVTANNRTWTYAYNEITNFEGEVVRHVLHQVIQPDSNYWEFSLDFLKRTPGKGFCTTPSLTTNYVKHPYGVTATYDFSTIRHIRVDNERTGTPVSQPYTCPNSGEQYSIVGRSYNKTASVTRKTFSGPSIPTSTWQYKYSEYPTDERGEPLDWSVYKTTEMIDPEGNTTISYFHPMTFRSGGGGYGTDEQKALASQLKKKQRFDSNDTLLEEKVYSYTIGDHLGAVGIHEKTSHRYQEYPSYTAGIVTERDGDTYTQNYTYNTNQSSSTYSFGSPIEFESFSNVSTLPQRTVTTYAHKKEKWILNLPSSISVNGRQTFAAAYDDFGRTTWEDQYEHRVATFDYHDEDDYLGALKSFTDAEDRVTQYLDYYRGKPRVIKRADNSEDALEMDDNGWVMSQTDYRGYTTNYERDVMGRLTRIVPSKTQKNWNETSIDYYFGDEVRQTIRKGNAYEVVTYDNLFRPIEESNTDLVESRPVYITTEYNPLGQVIFKSTPSRSVNNDFGVASTYDGLQRLKAREVRAEENFLTQFNYLSNHRRQVIDPRGYATIRQYDGYKGPGKGALIRIEQPHDVTTVLHRNDWGQLYRLQQYGVQNGYSVNQSQYYYYDNRQRLCRHRTPEGGDTLYAYDDSGHKTSYATGMSYGTSCATPSGTSKVTLTLDSLARVERTDYASTTTPDTHHNYDGNGNLTSLERGGIDWTYTYDELNNLTSEVLEVDGRTYSTYYQYDTMGHMNSMTYPSGRVLPIETNYLGQVTDVTFASDAKYHPSGDLESMAYANSVSYSRTEDGRQLPDEIVHMAPAGIAAGYRYAWDENANLEQLTHLGASLSPANMTYDGLDRLVTADSLWGDGVISYDALGNIRLKEMGAETLNYSYDSKNRLESVTGALNYSFSYDSRGNTTSNGQRNFSFDYSNQMTSSESISFEYDGHGRRVKKSTGGSTDYFIYNKKGKLIHKVSGDEESQKDYVYLGDKLVAKVERVFGQDDIAAELDGQWTNEDSHQKAYRIRNYWIKGWSLNIENGDPAASGILDGWWSAMWFFDEVDDFFRIQNRWKNNEYLHIENGILESSAAPEEWFSSHWVLDPVEGVDSAYEGKVYRIQNRHDTNAVLNVENFQLTASYVPTNYHSAYWIIEHVNADESYHETVTYSHFDHLGSVVAETNDDGEIIGRHYYYPFGENLLDPSKNNEPGYTNHVFDEDLGLNYMQARYYDPAIGRFLSMDPQGFRPGMPDLFNRYAYAGNNPMNRVDPDGELWVQIAVVAGLAIGAIHVASEWGSSGTKNIQEGRAGAMADYEQGNAPSAESKAQIAKGGAQLGLAGQSASLGTELGKGGIPANRAKAILRGAGALIGGLLGSDDEKPDGQQEDEDDENNKDDDGEDEQGSNSNSNGDG